MVCEESYCKRECLLQTISGFENKLKEKIKYGVGFVFDNPQPPDLPNITVFMLLYKPISFSYCNITGFLLNETK